MTTCVATKTFTHVSLKAYHPESDYTTSAEPGKPRPGSPGPNKPDNCGFEPGPMKRDDPIPRPQTPMVPRPNADVVKPVACC
ncbi:hypothetical protein N0V85_008344 [Neurospora sp. IMI 360204]|nr:hypothetical protein N0V85_008344 [Neurospora sp. IMI 360204]